MVAPSSAILFDRKDEELQNYQINQPLRLFLVEGASPVLAFSQIRFHLIEERKNYWGNPRKIAIYVV